MLDFNLTSLPLLVPYTTIHFHLHLSFILPLVSCRAGLTGILVPRSDTPPSSFPRFPSASSHPSCSHGWRCSLKFAAGSSDDDILFDGPGLLPTGRFVVDLPVAVAVDGPPLHSSYATGRGKPSPRQRIPCLLASSPSALLRRCDSLLYSFLLPCVFSCWAPPLPRSLPLGPVRLVDSTLLPSFIFIYFYLFFSFSA